MRVSSSGADGRKDEHPKPDGGRMGWRGEGGERKRFVGGGEKRVGTSCSHKSCCSYSSDQQSGSGTRDSEGEETERERGSGSSTKLLGINSNVRACLFLAACQHLTESIFTIKTA